MKRQPHLLHILPGFGTGGIQTVLCRVLNGLGRRYRHSVLALNGDLSASKRLDPALDVNLLPVDAPPQGRSARRQFIRSHSPDLVLTSNWGSYDWVIAQAFAPIAPHIHQEHGFGPDEARGEIARRVWARRLTLPFIHRLVVPSITLEEKAKAAWWLPRARIRRIANGVDAGDILRGDMDPQDRDLFPAERTIFATVAPLRAEKRIDRLIRAFASLPSATDEPSKSGTMLLIIGDGPERASLEELARQSGRGADIRFAGFRPEPVRLLAHADVYAISSDTEQLPASVLEAMALGLPVVGTAVGDVPVMIAEENRPYTVDRDDEAGLARAMGELARNGGLRETLGEANRRRQKADFDADAMVDAYRRLFDEALGEIGK
ncbi:MAG: glycosyltransferase [Geminicoccaceae bacterium]